MKILLIIVIALAALLLIGGCTAYTSYTGIVAKDEAASAQWAQIDTQLQRRYDLIPNLVETVQGYAGHEKEILTTLADARRSYFSAAPSERPAAAGSVESALSRLLMLQENYPQLKANEGFLKMQDQLEGTENRIGVERGRYNEAVKELNTTLRRPFSAMVNALFARVEPRKYFEVAATAREVPKVDFGTR